MKFSDVVFGHSEIRIQQIGTAIRRIVSLASEDSAKKEFDYERNTELFGDCYRVCVLPRYVSDYRAGRHPGVSWKSGCGKYVCGISAVGSAGRPCPRISTALNTVVASARIREKLAGFVGTKETPQEETLPAQPGINGKELQTIEISDLTLKRGNDIFSGTIPANLKRTENIWWSDRTGAERVR